MDTNKILAHTLGKNLGDINETLSKLSRKEGSLVIVEMLLQALRGADGVDGKDGKDGKTPVKGKDYFTEREAKVFTQTLLKKMRVPVRGKDYWSRSDVAFIIGECVRQIPVPKVGKDFYTEAEKAKYLSSLKKEFKEFIKSMSKQGAALTIKRLEEKATQSIIGDGVRRITVSNKPPLNPSEGDIWIQTLS